MKLLNGDSSKMTNEIYIMGDIHGSFKPIRDLVSRNPQLKDHENTLILLGDFGANYFLNERDNQFKKQLGKYPFTYFAIRGNHEERPEILAEKYPFSWHVEDFWGQDVWVENDYPYIKYAMDYVAIYHIPYGIDYITPEKPEDDDIEMPLYYRALVIPGAYSVDKYYRLTQGWSWFPQEQLSESEKLAGKSLINVLDWKCDLVLSHTCPICYEPTDLFLSTVDQSMVDKSMERYLGEIEYKLDYKLWCFGHFHDTRIYPKNGSKQMLMLFNNKAINLKDYMEGKIIKL